jgi:hypothetical protein
MNGDGRATEDEALWQVFARVTRLDVDAATAGQFAIALDKGDVHWLRGYCHLLGATCEMFLAYDTHKLHDYTAHLFFPTAQVRYPEAVERDMMGTIADVIAFIHLLQLPVVANAAASTSMAGPAGHDGPARQPAIGHRGPRAARARRDLPALETPRGTAVPLEYPYPYAGCRRAAFRPKRTIRSRRSWWRSGS